MVLAVIAALPCAVSAQPRESPQELYDLGVAAFQVRDLATALANFQRAYLLSRRPELLMNVGMVFQAAERRRDAIDTFRQFLSMAPAAANRAEVLERIALLEREITALRTPTPPVLAPPVPSPAVLSPTVLSPTVRAPVPLPSRSTHSAPAWPWITLSAGAVAAVAGAVMTLGPSDPGTDPSVTTEQAYLDARGLRSTLQVAGVVTAGIGLAAVALGALRLATRARTRGIDTAWNLHVTPLPDGGAFGVGRAF